MLPIKVTASAIQSLEISRGKSRSAGAKRGMLWGTPFGALFGVLLTGENNDCPSCIPPYEEESNASIVASGALGGLAWGALIGALIGRARWDSFDLPHRTAVEVAPGRASFALRYQS